VKLTAGEQVSGYEKYFKGNKGLDCYLKFQEGLNYFQGHSPDDTRRARRITEEATLKARLNEATGFPSLE
jgi:hypothetical protein